MKRFDYHSVIGGIAISILFSCGGKRIAVPLQRQNKKVMKRKTIGIIVAVLVLAFAGGIGWSLRD
ncbi:MAG: hypothetical protein IJT48_06600, partial [Bacteroidaceae bacterium]|nr:hypothetical protein [Bacteroidaceae bacterium]